MYHGVINIYKEAGYTSHDVVARIRGICGQKKVGHTGTLDPDATGVLPVCLGSGTKLCDMLTDQDKEYEAELLLGCVTDTQDMSGKILGQNNVTARSEEIRQAVKSFQGDYLQIPPMYSALKVNGKKLYELARAGKEVERNARQVRIHKIEIIDMKSPVVHIRVNCSKGTYIRTLCADIGDKLGCGGAMASLKRTRVGRFTMEDSVTLSSLETLRQEGRVEEKLYPVDNMFADCPSAHLMQETVRLVENGNPFFPEQTLEGKAWGDGEWIRVYDEDHRFYGIYAYDNSRLRYQPVKMFLT